MSNLWNKKIPTYIGIILITIGVLTTSYLVNIGVTLFSGAAPSDNPMNVRISNVTDQALSITYTTQIPVIGTVSIGTSKDNLQTILDDRDQQSGVPNEYMVHSITVKKLQPNTQYIFSITSGSTTYLNHDTLFPAQTGPTFSTSPSEQTPLSGKLIDPDGQTPKEALVLITTTNGQMLSTVVKQNGIFILPLNTLRTSNFKHMVVLTPTSQLQIIATDGTNDSRVKVNLQDGSPLPMITLGNSYDFTASIAPVASTSASLGFPSFNANSTLEATPVIITPKKNESFSDQQPQFSGKGLPNQPVAIEIHSDNVISATVTTNTNGTWTYRPITPLSPGQHIISITTKNAAGILQTIEQSFTVYASGSQVDQTATPSATVVPTRSVTPTPTPTPTQGPVTPSPTLQPTATILPTRTLISPTPVRTQLPPTGSNSLTVAAGIGLVTTTVGIVLYIVSLGVL